MEPTQESVSVKGSHLVVILDLSFGCELQTKRETFFKWLDSTLSFANSHLLLSASNKLTIIVSTSSANEILYPDEHYIATPSQDGQYELFSTVIQVVQSKLNSLLSRQVDSSSVSGKSSLLLSGAIGMALCCIQRCKEAYKSSRIAIISGSSNASYSLQYMNLMNSFFTAQRIGVVIDVCCVNDTENIISDAILHQASELTNGIYLRVTNVSAFLEYLLWCLLPDTEIRSHLVLPPRKKISHQAACFCHQNLIEIGFVCSVCLSIFCNFSPFCQTCHTAFKLDFAKKKRQRNNGTLL